MNLSSLNQAQQNLQRVLGYQFKQADLLVLALTHRSSHSKLNYERLEFMGDALLSAVVAQELYLRYPKKNEGELTRMRARLVRQETLALVARELGLSEHLIMGEGELKAGGRGRDSILSDVVESILGAIYLDSGSFDVVKSRILNWFDSMIQHVDQLKTLKDPKSQLQEFLQSQSKPLPVYELLRIEGKAPLETFYVRCSSGQNQIETRGKSRKIAEQIAAQSLLERIKGVSV